MKKNSESSLEYVGDKIKFIPLPTLGIIEEKFSVLLRHHII